MSLLTCSTRRVLNITGSPRPDISVTDIQAALRCSSGNFRRCNRRLAYFSAALLTVVANPAIAQTPPVILSCASPKHRSALSRPAPALIYSSAYFTYSSPALSSLSSAAVQPFPLPPLLPLHHNLLTTPHLVSPGRSDSRPTTLEHLVQHHPIGALLSLSSSVSSPLSSVPADRSPVTAPQVARNRSLDAPGQSQQNRHSSSSSGPSAASSEKQTRLFAQYFKGGRTSQKTQTQTQMYPSLVQATLATGLDAETAKGTFLSSPAPPTYAYLVEFLAPFTNYSSSITCSASSTSSSSTTSATNTYTCTAPIPSPLVLLSLSPIRRRALAAAITAMSQTRAHSGHSHGHHHHHHDNVYLTSKNKNDAGVRITRIGLFANLSMAVAKGIGGYAFHSHALVADAYHSLTDLASDIMTLMTVSWSLKEPTKAYPTGFGKVESLGSLGVSGMLLTGGLLMCWGSFIALLTQLGVDLSFLGSLLEHGHNHGHGHGHGHGVDVPSLHAAWLAGGTVLVKEWLYHKTMAVARERKSSVLASNAIHHRIDSLTGIVTLGIVLASNWFTSASWLDPVGGLLISGLVIKAGTENTISAITELADRAIDDEVTQQVRKYTLRVLDELEPGHGLELRSVSGVKSGQNYLIDLEVAIPTGWNVEQMKILEDSIRFHIGSRVRGAKRVRVRFVPVDGENKEFDEFVPGNVTPKELTPEPELEHKHEHDHDHGHACNHKHEGKKGQ